MLLLFVAVLMPSADAQRGQERERADVRRSDRGELRRSERGELIRSDRGGFRNNRSPKNCKNSKVRNGRKMKRMAAADSRITPREKKMMRRERRREF